MPALKGRTLFFITSPRTPAKMEPEIRLLTDSFSGQTWNQATQKAFMHALANADFFQGRGSGQDMAFSARDRINRGPKALGLVDLSPSIQLTPAGRNFLQSDSSAETLLRQLLKFQLPSPYHQQGKSTPIAFCVKPFLEIFRLIRKLGTLRFDELMIFGMQLTSYRKFDAIVKKIQTFRAALAQHPSTSPKRVSLYL